MKQHLTAVPVERQSAENGDRGDERDGDDDESESSDGDGDDRGDSDGVIE